MLTIKQAKRIFKKILFWIVFEGHKGTSIKSEGYINPFRTLSSFMLDGANQIVHFTDKNREGYFSYFKEAKVVRTGVSDFENDIMSLLETIFPCITIFHSDDLFEVKDLFINEWKNCMDTKCQDFAPKYLERDTALWETDLELGEIEIPNDYDRLCRKLCKIASQWVDHFEFIYFSDSQQRWMVVTDKPIKKRMMGCTSVPFSWQPDRKDNLRIYPLKK